MNTSLAYNTVNPSLLSVLKEVMSEGLFNDFILVGGTALSLRLGHRISVDIDMFTAMKYGSIIGKALKWIFVTKSVNYSVHKKGALPFYSPQNSLSGKILDNDHWL